MLLTKISNLENIHTTGTNRTVDDKLSRYSSQIINKKCQVQHKTFPPHIEFFQLKPNSSLIHIQYLVKRADSQTNHSHPILNGSGHDRITLRVQFKGYTVTYIPLDPFSFQTASPLLNKHIKPIKNKIKALLQRNPLENETDLYEEDDPVKKRILQQNQQSPQLSHTIHSLFLKSNTSILRILIFLEIC